MELSRVPPRVLVALGVTVLALVVLGVRALVGGDGDASAPTTTSSTTASTATTAAPASSTSVEVLPDWYPKQTSRYSEREPVVSLTTVPTTSSTSTTAPAAGAGPAAGRSGGS